MKNLRIFFLFLVFITLSAFGSDMARNRMMFGDTTRTGRPFSKDPHVIEFKGRYLMYYSIPPREGENASMEGWGVGIAESMNLKDWKRIGEIIPRAACEAKGLCAPGALVRNDTVHLFYQTYGNGRNDAICHAWSVDGVRFERDPSNPVFSPSGDWNCGRAIDAEVIFFNEQYYLYYATRTPDYAIQLIGVATAPVGTAFSRGEWTEPVHEAVLKPQYPWEGFCVEGASVVQHGSELFMFYAGAYNNQPQQVGVARSKDGIRWEKISNKPFLTNGDPGSWNYCESGHPHLFKNREGKTWLFYQGNDDFGNTWYLSNTGIFWNSDGLPYHKQK